MSAYYMVFGLISSLALAVNLLLLIAPACCRPR